MLPKKRSDDFLVNPSAAQLYPGHVSVLGETFVPLEISSRTALFQAH